MRNLLVILLFLIVFIVGSVLWEGYLDNEFKDIINDIEQITSVEQIEEVSEKWEKISDKAGIMINHNELEEVSQKYDRAHYYNEFPAHPERFLN